MTNQCASCGASLTSNRSVWSPRLCTDCCERAFVWAAKQSRVCRDEVHEELAAAKRAFEAAGAEILRLKRELDAVVKRRDELAAGLRKIRGVVSNGGQILAILNDLFVP
jgi:predicted  nucleic acid-binding Zn-ribbon protein